jgi:hypothetical protein
MKWRERSMELAIEYRRLDLVAAGTMRRPVQEYRPSIFAHEAASTSSLPRCRRPRAPGRRGATGGADDVNFQNCVVDGSGDFEHAASATATSRTAIFSVMIDVRAC